MTKREWLNGLRAALQGLPPEEREAAIEFYEEYIADAGPENEQAVLSGLGSPQEVARQILAGSDQRYTYNPPAPGPRRRFQWWLILVGVIGFPILFPLLIVAAVLAFVAVLVTAVLIFTFAAVVVSLLFAGVLGLVAWFLALGGLALPFTSITGDALGLGLVLSCLGLGLLLLWPCVWLISRGVPFLVHKLKAIWQQWKRRKRK